MPEIKPKELFKECLDSPDFIRLEARVSKNSDNIADVHKSLQSLNTTLESVRRWIIVGLITSIAGVGGSALSIGKWQGTIETKLYNIQIALNHHLGQIAP